MNKNDNLFNIITLGDCGVGKTSILKKFAYDTFDEKSLSTIGIGFSFKEVELKDGTKIQLKLVDTSGQEKYKSLAKSYYKNAKAVIFVFSYDNKQSFEHIEEWFNNFKENRDKEDICMFLIGNKCDVENKVIEDDLIENLKNIIGIKDYLETSAKKNINIEELFSQIAEKIYISKKRKGEHIQMSKTLLQKRKKKSGCC